MQELTEHYKGNIKKILCAKIGIIPPVQGNTLCRQMKSRFDNRRVAVLASFSGEGGVERMLLNLLRAWVDQGVDVDLLRIKRRGPFAERTPAGVNTIDLPMRHSWGNIVSLARYFRNHPLRPLLAAKERAGQTALVARKLARTRNRIFIRLGTHLSTALKDKSAPRRWLRFKTAGLLYPSADGIIAISRGVAEDVARFAQLPEEMIRVIPNPVISPEIKKASMEPVDHPWLIDGSGSVLLAAGRLTRQKDFSTLIRALAKIRESREARLIILGEGPKRAELEDLTRQLGLECVIDMPGFATNPYKFMAQADVFVLSSVWEGFGNVLAEAMSLGIPVVSTDCPSGPGEMLQQGSLSPLAGVGDPQDLARAVLGVLENPPSPETLQNAVADYAVEASAKRYLDTLFPI